jgi:phospholipid transport system substrate-binding protein
MRRCVSALCFILLGAAVTLQPAGGVESADPAVARLREFYSVLLQTMKNADRLKVKGRYDKLAPVVGATFDLPAMTRVAIGPQWRTVSPDQQAQLIDAFTRLTTANYASRFDGFSGQQFEVDPQPVDRGGNRIVQSRIIRPGEDPVSLNYLFHATPQGWKIVDIYLSGTISEVATRRSEFSAILKSKGPAALIDTLKQRIDKLMAG